MSSRISTCDKGNCRCKASFCMSVFSAPSGRGLNAEKNGAMNWYISVKKTEAADTNRSVSVNVVIAGVQIRWGEHTEPVVAKFPVKQRECCH